MHVKGVEISMFKVKTSRNGWEHGMLEDATIFPSLLSDSRARRLSIFRDSGWSMVRLDQNTAAVELLDYTLDIHFCIVG